MLEKALDLSGICTELMDEYDVGREQCLKETGELIEEMVKLGLILAEVRFEILDMRGD
ncbi:MAG: PqqD family protein [Sphingobacterium sp.]|nr:PqqD family protein [Sphingobacterium sp.]